MDKKDAWDGRRRRDYCLQLQVSRFGIGSRLPQIFVVSALRGRGRPNFERIRYTIDCVWSAVSSVCDLFLSS